MRVVYIAGAAPPIAALPRAVAAPCEYRRESAPQGGHMVIVLSGWRRRSFVRLVGL
jgi:hypothetical protein